jgi:uncharacterized damage-inducible protein DinB
MNINFDSLFQYNTYCNQQLIQHAQRHPWPEKSVLLFSHILNAHEIWNARILELPILRGVWALRPQAQWQQIQLENDQTTATIVQTLGGDPLVSYQNSRGSSFTNSVRDILFHIINHSTYHRAQIATDFRNQGLEPLLTDYIFYKRNELL